MAEWKRRRRTCAVCGDRLNDLNRSKPYPARCKPCVNAYYQDYRAARRA